MSFKYNEVALSEIAQPVVRTVEVVAGQSYRTIGVKWWGEGAYERQTIDGSQTAAKTLSMVRESDLIINKIWVRHGSTAIVPHVVDGCAASGEFPTFSLDSCRVVPRWIHWITKTRSFWEKCAALSRGTSGKNRIKPELFLTVRVPLPTLAEQRRIVARIEQLSAQLDQARALRQQAAKEAEKLIATVLRTLYSNSALKVARFGTMVLSCTNGLSRRPVGTEHGPIVLRLADVANGDVNLSAPRRGDVSDLEQQRYSLAVGDLLFVRVNGSRQIIGRCVPIRTAPEIICYNDHLIRVRLDDRVLDWRYAYLMANSPQSREYIEATAITTAGQLTVNQKMLEALPMPIPPLAVQRQIVSQLDLLQAEVSTLKALQKETSAELDALMPSILDKAFRGEL